jgi:transcription termination/antitermination protein NusA
MVKILLTQELMGFMSLFSKITRVPVKDCFTDSQGLLTFVVSHQFVGKAVGKKAVNIQKLERLLKRKIRILGFHVDVTRFVLSVVFPLRVASIEKEDSTLLLKDGNKKTKSLLIGRNAQNLRNTETIVRRYFSEITEIKVI